MGSSLLIFFLFISLISLFSLIKAQQPYVRKAFNDCDKVDNSTSVLGYTCNGLNKTCKTYLTFRSKPPFNTVSTISSLIGADPLELSQLNSVSVNAAFGTDKLVLVPMICSCSGEYYQANTSYVIEHENTYFLIANDTFQGLSTCHALKAQNSNFTRNLYTGTRINVPLRCACPTKNQTNVGINYLLSYLVTWSQSVSAISNIFGVNTGRTLEANGLSEVDYTIYPFTTLLIPLQNPPSSSQTLAPPPPPPPPPPPSSPTGSHSTNKSSKTTWVPVVSGVLGGVVITLGFGAIVFCIFFQSKKKIDLVKSSESFEACEKVKPMEKDFKEEPNIFLESVSGIAQTLKVYTFEELKSATENFNPSYCIKGSVYRGKINGDLAAIKKMDGDVSSEINLLNKINHFNLIRLSGVCFNDGHCYIVYEYAVNGPLSDWIYNNGDQKFLNWTQRVQIALDVATGLNYLHCYTSPPYVHKDVKSSNVLLDSDFRAKIANFGLARSAEGQEGHFALTRHIVGTKGYMAPEYLENGFVSPKLDVYAFGVLLLEIITGKEVLALYEGVEANLSEVLNDVLREEDGKENLREFMDPSFRGNYPTELAIFVARLADRCIKKDPLARPGMDEIAQSLSNVVTSSMNWDLSNSISGYRSY